MIARHVQAPSLNDDPQNRALEPSLMNATLISVVLTTYNRSSLLPRAIESVLAGTYENFEIVIVDDASTDNTPKVLLRFFDARIRYERLSQNGGVLRARNRGFDLARGDIVTMLDDDDELLPDALSTVADEFANTINENVGILWFDCRDAESGEISGTMPMKRGVISFEDYVCGRVYGDFWMAFRKTVLDGYRFNENLKAHESLLWLRIQRTHKASYVPTVVCSKFRDHGLDRLCDLHVRMGQLKHTMLALNQFVEEFGPDLIRLCPDIFGRKLAYLGLHQMAANDFSGGRSSIRRSLKYRFSAKYILFYIASFVLRPRHVVSVIAQMES